MISIVLINCTDDEGQSLFPAIKTVFEAVELLDSITPRPALFTKSIVDLSLPYFVYTYDTTNEQDREDTHDALIGIRNVFEEVSPLNFSLSDSLKSVIEQLEITYCVYRQSYPLAEITLNPFSSEVKIRRIESKKEMKRRIENVI